jgi:DNA-binding transcriptional MerR regulator
MDKGKYLIGEVAEISGASQKCIRSWEKHLGPVDRISCGSMKYRFFSEQQLEIISAIKYFLDAGFRLQVATRKAKETLSCAG